MNKKFKILSLVLCVAIVLSLCACGGSKPSSSEVEGGELLGFEDEVNITVSGTNSTSGGAQGGEGNGADTGNKVESKIELSGSDPFANVPKRLKGTTVVFAQWGDEGAAEYQKVAKAFEKKTGIRIQWKNLNEGEYVAQVAKLIAGKASPDIVVVNGTMPHIFEVLQPLNNIVDLKDSFWDQEIVKMGTIGKNSYFVNSLESVWENNYMVFYNKEIFAKNGITSPTEYYNQNKWTYENFKKCLQEVVKTGNIGGYFNPELMNGSLGASTVIYDPNTNKYSANYSKSEVGYKFVAECFKEGLWSSTAWWGTFAAGNIGLYSSTVYGAKYNGFFKEANDSILAAVPLPTSYQGKAAKPSGSVRGYGICKGAKNPEGAAYFLRYYLDYKGYYADAGAKVFKNKSLEKVAMEDVVKEIKAKGRNFTFDGAYYNSGTYEKDVLAGLEKADPTQVASLIQGKKNVIDGVITKANEKMASYSK